MAGMQLTVQMRRNSLDQQYCIVIPTSKFEESVSTGNVQRLWTVCTQLNLKAVIAAAHNVYVHRLS